MRKETEYCYKQYTITIVEFKKCLTSHIFMMVNRPGEAKKVGCLCVGSGWFDDIATALEQGKKLVDSCIQDCEHCVSL